MMRVIIPVVVVVTLLQWSGWLYWIDLALKPLMKLINLPGEAALPILIGILTGIYGSVAAITVLPFSMAQMTLIAIFNLTAHNMIAEGIIQKNSGMSLVRITIIRLAAAALLVLIASQFFDDTARGIAATNLATNEPLLDVLTIKAIDTLKLSAKIFGIIMAIMIVLESLTALGWVEHLVKPLRPVMRIFGLADRATMAWLTAVVFGLMYGGAVIVDEARKGGVTQRELEHLHISIGINHSLGEDTLLYIAIGINAFWLLAPRLILAIIEVQSLRALEYVMKRLSSMPR